MKKILFLCLGNTCRSPMAAGILQQKATEYGVDLLADSAGFESFHIGDPPDKRAIDTTKKFGIDISNHRARLFRVQDFDNFDTIYVMDHKNYKEASYFARDDSDLAKLNYLMALLAPGSRESVPDPFLAEPEACEYVYQILGKACDAIIDKVRSEKQTTAYESDERRNN